MKINFRGVNMSSYMQAVWKGRDLIETKTQINDDEQLSEYEKVLIWLAHLNSNMPRELQLCDTTIERMAVGLCPKK